MKNRLKSFIASFVFALSFMAFVPVTATFAADGCGDAYLIGSGATGMFPAWYNGLTANVGGDCVVRSPTDDGGTISSFIWTIVLNIVQCLIQAAGWIAAGFIIVGGFQFMLNGSDSAAVARGRTTILNAVIGLVIAIVASSIIKLILGIIS